jgi:L-threonylcarbamoyladenylate synthase
VTRVFHVDPGIPATFEQAIEHAAAAIRGGGLVVFPTETLYALATAPGDPDATSRVFALKRRPKALSLPVLAPARDLAMELVVANGRAERLARRYWPGPLTLVLPRSDRSKGWELGDREASIGVRVPNHQLSAALLERAGPVAATSANLSGQPPASAPGALLEAFGQGVDVYVVLREGVRPPAGPASTVLDLTGPAIEVLRWGGVDPEEIRAFLGRSGGKTQWVHFD